MNFSELLRWQWDGYTNYHASRANLLLHIVVVPLFLLGNVILVVALLQGAMWPALAGLVAMVVSFALQGKGHSMEAVPSIPFASPLQAVARIFIEQWINFPRFVLSGGWLRALRQASR
jgi:uncharacterized membrane protein YGL010W